MLIAPGSIVRARARRHLVVDVNEHGTCRSVRLAPIEGSGDTLTLLHPFDRMEVLPAVDTPTRASRRKVARACAAVVRGSYHAGETRTLVEARVDLLPYQLEPALAVLRGETTRVLLADEVGLGKTVQAGLILSELRARNLLRRALVLTPAGLREQWTFELARRFGLETTIVDAGILASLQRSLPPWVNPWTLPGVALASIDLLKRDELLPQLEHVVWDAVVVDEAHHATRGTDRHQAASLACSRARFVVLITATPHNGDRSAFEELCSLGAAADGRSPLRIFRRTRADAHNGFVRRARRTRLVKVRRSAVEQRMDAALRSYTTRVWREGGTDARLAMIVLRKRALSGAASLARSVKRRLESLAGAEQPEVSESQLPLDFADSVDGELNEDDREPSGELAARGLEDARTERQLLANLLEAARMARREDSKADRLASAVLRAREQVIVFTEYRDTLDDLRRRLDGFAPLTLLHGGLMPAERARAIRSFESGAARVLLATDAAAEGLNLQQRCRWVIHNEVPWSPVRIEQRNGRADRIGQSRRVHVWHLVAAGTEEDAILARVAERASIAASDLGDQENVAAAVFGERSLAPRTSPRKRRPSDPVACTEVKRIEALRRLPGHLTPSIRPLQSVLRRRHLRILGVLQASVLDPTAGPIASACVGVHAPGLGRCWQTAEKELGHDARRSIAIHAAFGRAIRERDKSILATLGDSRGETLQPSLFDRQVVIRAEHRHQARERALEELASQRRAPGKPVVRISLVGVLPG